MGANEPEEPVSSADRTIFVPLPNSRNLKYNVARIPDFWPRLFFNPEVDFEKDSLLLMQNSQGCYLWGCFRDLFGLESKMCLRPCSLTFQQADNIVKCRVLLVPDSYNSLCDFSILSQCSRPPTIVNSFDNFDLVTRHLASTREVQIFTIKPDGRIACDEIKTADYCRAKADIKNNPADTRNMRRFCNRQYNGEGPSNLNSRICPGYVPQRTTWPPSVASSSFPLIDNPFPQETPKPQHKQPRSLPYYLMKAAFVPIHKIDAHQYAHDLKRARKEKQPEHSAPPHCSRWVAAFMKNRARTLYSTTMQRRRFTPKPSSREQLLVADTDDEEQGENNKVRHQQKRQNAYSLRSASCNAAIECSSSLTSHEHEAISPLLLPAPAYPGRRIGVTGLPPPADHSAAMDIHGATSYQNVVSGESVLNMEILEGIIGDERRFRQKMEAGRQAACESQVPFADPGLRTRSMMQQAVERRGRRDWEGNGGWRWIFDEGLG
jgi:hypothetical protein